MDKKDVEHRRGHSAELITRTADGADAGHHHGHPDLAGRPLSLHQQLGPGRHPPVRHHRSGQASTQQVVFSSSFTEFRRVPPI